jgi:hypothetical protein
VAFEIDGEAGTASAHSCFTVHPSRGGRERSSEPSLP